MGVTDLNCKTSSIILQILSLTLFENTSLIQLLAGADHTMEGGGMANQLDLFDN